MNPKYVPLLIGGVVALAIVPALCVAFLTLEVIERAIWLRMGAIVGLASFAIWGVIRLWIGACFNYQKELKLLDARLDLQHLKRKSHLASAKQNGEVSVGRLR